MPHPSVPDSDLTADLAADLVAPARVPRPSVPDAGLVAAVRLRWEEPRVRIAVLLLVAGIAGFVWFRLGSSSTASPSGAPDRASAPPSRSAPDAATRAARAATTRAAASVVHVAGAVARPGVVRVPAGGRVVDAIDAAGGSVGGADLDALNLAAKVVDGQRILVPRIGEPAVPALDAGGATGDVAAGDASTPVNLNSASPAALEGLPGIGPALAEAIVRYREEHSGFRSVAELQEVRGIGDARFADLEPLVTV